VRSDDQRRRGAETERAAAVVEEAAVGQVAVRSRPADADRGNTIEEDSFFGRVGE